MRELVYSLILLCCCLSLSSCQKAFVEDEEKEETRNENGVKLQLCITKLGDADFENIPIPS